MGRNSLEEPLDRRMDMVKFRKHNEFTMGSQLQGQKINVTHETIEERN